MLLQGVALGMAGYALALFLLWRAAGMPPGAEGDVLLLLRRITARLPLRRAGMPQTGGD